MSVTIWRSWDLLLLHLDTKTFFQLLRFVSSLLPLQGVSFLWSYTVSQVEDLPLPPPYSYYPELRILCLFPAEYWELLKFSILRGAGTGSNTAELEVKDRLRICLLVIRETAFPFVYFYMTYSGSFQGFSWICNKEEYSLFRPFSIENHCYTF